MVVRARAPASPVQDTAGRASFQGLGGVRRPTLVGAEMSSDCGIDVCADAATDGQPGEATQHRLTMATNGFSDLVDRRVVDSVWCAVHGERIRPRAVSRPETETVYCFGFDLARRFFSRSSARRIAFVSVSITSATDALLHFPLLKSGNTPTARA